LGIVIWTLTERFAGERFIFAKEQTLSEDT